jgi:predicted RNA-binding Zn ribbon-like protein
VDSTPTWEWLEGDPALDFANTVIRRGWTEHELVTTVSDLESWLDAAVLPAPRPDAVTDEDVRAFLQLRDPALRLLRSAAGHGEWRSADVRTVNDALLSCPEVALLGAAPGSVVSQLIGSPRPFAVLLFRLAAEVRETLAAARADLALCDAPGCGQLFFQRRTNQTWCGAPCGNRARVARHNSAESHA